MVHRFLPALALIAALAACQQSNPIGPLDPGSEYDIAAVPLSIVAESPLKVAVAVLEQRPYVLDGDESPKFLGTERGAWSQTVTIKTRSGRGLSEDLADLIAGALRRAGVDATPLALDAKANEADAEAAFQASGADRLLEVRLMDWSSDSYTRVVLKLRLEAAVQDRGGAVLGRSSVSGNAPVGNTTASENGERITQREMARHLRNLLGDPGITRGLR